MNRNEDDILPSSSYWFPNSSEIVAGGSAIIGGNRVAFFAIHHTALCTITVSFVASVIVISKIIGKWRNSAKLDLSIRFPFYLAVAEALWGISHFSDHFYLVTAQRYPTAQHVKLALSINLWFFFGYQQMMHASVAAYTYLRVVRQKTLNLGKYEWKLHLMWAVFLIVTILVFFTFGCFGNSGYWMMYDARSMGGMLLGVAMAVTSGANACCTTLGYYFIKRTVVRMKANLKSHKVGPPNGSGDKPENSLACRCLTTYVWMAACLYIPLAILLGVNILFQIFLSIVEPISSWLLVIVANSSGWANAVAYFHNEELKRKREMTARVAISQNTNSTERTFDSDDSRKTAKAYFIKL